MMTRPLVFALALVVLLVAAAALAQRGSGAAFASGVVGDTTCDLAVDETDALALLSSMAGPESGSGCIYNGDVDCDSHHTSADVARVLRYAAGLTNPPIPGCMDVGSVYQTTPSPSPSADQSPPPGPTNTTTPSPTATVATATATKAPTATPTPTPTGGATASPAPTFTPTLTPDNTPSPGQTPQVGGEPDCQVFPADNPWNTDVSGFQLHPDSDAIVDRIGRYEEMHPDFGTVWDGKPIGIPYVIVGGDQPKVPITYYYSDSDPGPYPIPPDVPVEGQPVGQPNTAGFGGDRHTIVIDDANCILYETFDSHPVNGGQSWDTGSAAIFDLGSNALRPEGWTSADAAGLPIFAGLVRYEEVVEQGVIDHALRFTVEDSRRAYIHPATHWASDLTAANLPPMGMRFRMKSSYDCSWTSVEIQVVCTALKKYGMFVADNGSDWYLSGAPDPRWDDDALGDLKDIPGDAFEVVHTGDPVTP